jgi:hypothetical protein
MLRLDLSNAPHWLDLMPDLRVHLTPLTTALMVAARNDAAVTALSEDVSDEERALVFAKAIAKIAILDWEGVGDVDGHTIPVSPEGIDALLDIYPVFEAFQLCYVSKGLLMDAEKNVSAPLPNGSSVGAQATAPPASPPRAASPANPTRVTRASGKRAKTARAKSTGR